MRKETKLAVLMIEIPQREGISARKLVLETALHNVITAYSGAEGVELFRRFPNVDLVIVHSELQDVSCDELVRELRGIRPGVPVIQLSPNDSRSCAPADFSVNSHQPQALLNLLAEQFGAVNENP